MRQHLVSNGGFISQSLKDSLCLNEPLWPNWRWDLVRPLSSNGPHQNLDTAHVCARTKYFIQHHHSLWIYEKFKTKYTPYSWIQTSLRLSNPDAFLFTRPRLLTKAQWTGSKWCSSQVILVPYQCPMPSAHVRMMPRHKYTTSSKKLNALQVLASCVQAFEYLWKFQRLAPYRHRLLYR